MNMHSQFARLMDLTEWQLRQEIGREQVRKVDLTEYRAGHPHYERLMTAMADAQRYQSPESLEFNL